MTLKPYCPKSYVLTLDPVWAAEFRAFFMGEGCATITRRKDKGTILYQPQLAIRLRDDERPLIEDIVAHLGGMVTKVPKRLSPEGYLTNPALFWHTVGYPKIRGIIEATDLANPVLPAHKRLDIRILYEYILARYEMPGFRLGAANRAILEDFHTRLVAVRKYKPFDC